MTRLVGVIEGPTIEEAKRQIEQAKPLADLIELRLDLFDSKALDQLGSLPKDLPRIFTLRKQGQGGGCKLEEPKRLQLYEQLLKHEPEYCDIETDTHLEFFETVHLKHPKTKIIGSFHDFEKMPEDVNDVLEKMHKAQISHYKIAINTVSVNDALRLMHFARDKPKLTCIAMGPEGQISRILAPMIGSEFCYASVEEKPAAPGQLSLSMLKGLYRFSSIGPHTKIYALLGDPVDKSIGHLYHNKSFPKDTVYIKLRLAIPELPLFFSLMRHFPFHGFSVTMPLKELLGKVLTETDPDAERIGSINTIFVDSEGKLIGYNTDGVGALNALEKHRPVKGKKVAILGAGGTARAIAYIALKRGAAVTVLNRTMERAQTLAKEFGIEACELSMLSKVPYDLLINTIPVDQLIDEQSLHPKALIMDVVYWEDETPLLKAGKARGCECIGGLEMFEEQALLQQKIWFK